MAAIASVVAAAAQPAAAASAAASSAPAAEALNAAAAAAASSSSTAVAAARVHQGLPELRILTADYDSEGIYVYQAYKPSIGLEAVARQSFKGIPDFSPTRMTWIKFSLGWMLYRCDYARAKNQEVVLRIQLSWPALWSILRASCGSFFDSSLFPTKEAWQTAMAAADVRWQWDPERNLAIKKLGNNQRALQLGMKREIGISYATNPEWILKIENYTSVATEIRACLDEGRELPVVPVEKELKIEDPVLRKILGMDSIETIADFQGRKTLEAKKAKADAATAVAAAVPPADDGSASSGSSSQLQ